MPQAEENEQNRKRKKGKNPNPKPGPGKRPGSPFGGTGSGYSRILFWLFLLMLFGFWYFSRTGGFGGASQVGYSTFKTQLNKDNVSQVLVKGETIQGHFKNKVTRVNADGDTASVQQFITYLPSFGDDQLMSNLEQHGVDVQTQPQNNTDWWTILIFAMPILLLIGVGYMFFRRMQMQGQNMFSIGQSRAKLQKGEEVDTDFDDVAGAEGAKTELKEIIGFLKNPERFERLGGEVPRGILMVGPPGTGKTLLARAVAGEADVPFFTITGSDFMEMFVGVGAKRVRDMFEKAKARAPSIIFIDEIDSIGRRRGAGLGGGHDEREQTLNQLLSELDGFEPNEGVIVMAATNRPDILDKALLRPGRFDRQITVELPTRKHRVAILKLHASNKKMADDVDLDDIAKGTPGFSGADLKNLLNEAALLAARRENEAISQEDIEQARDKIMMGLERKGVVLTEDEKKMIAYHAGGHAVVAAAMPNADPIHKVTIIPRGRAMGVTQQLPENDKYIYKQEYMLDRMAVMMGGRAAENLVFNTATSGAENDLKQITQLARRMVLDWGMSEKFGHMALGQDNDEVFLGKQLGQKREYSDSTAREADEEVKRILEEAYKRARETLEENREVLDRVADLLLEKEEIPGSKVLELLNGNAS